MRVNGAAEGKLLNSWKEIAQYLGRGVRTVQRWESALQLPVRRPHGKSRSSVIAIKSEIDEWLAKTPASALTSERLSSEVVHVDDWGGVGSHVSGVNQQKAPKKLRVLVVEDDAADLNSCVQILTQLGVAEIDADSNIPAAIARLQHVATGTLTGPDLIILDLAFPAESGFEVLRHCRSNPNLRNIPVIVWTKMDGKQKELCHIFGVKKVVSKWAGSRELESALRSAHVI
jgi:CheY-like chemotaxis protein/predicted DNA-binding transcriptional regulator AlpA